MHLITSEVASAGLKTPFAVQPLQRRAVLLLGVLVAVCLPAHALDVHMLNPNGAWCWFQDERALMSGDQLVVTSISSTGTVDVTSYDTATSALTVAPIRLNFGNDDHNVAALLHRDDGRYMAFYAKHHVENKMFVRVSNQADDATTFGVENFYSFGISSKTTYANPFQLSEENGRIYLFWRGLNFWPTYSTSDNGGTSWATAANIIADAAGNTNTRPYAKYCSNNRDTIHIAYTDAHPRNLATNSVYHIYYRGGNLYKSDGTLLRSLARGPVLTTQGTKVYDGAGPSGRGWTWDITLDQAENPVMVHTTVPSISDHRYRYGRYNPISKRWFENEIAYAGTGLYTNESEYSGGICLDPDDISVVYISANVHPSTGLTVGTGKREIYRGKSLDGGLTWAWTPVTSNSTQDNIRPIVPKNHPAGIFVLWMQGRYTTFTNYDTRIMLATEASEAGIAEWQEHN